MIPNPPAPPPPEAPGDQRNDIVIPDVNWGTSDIIIATMITMLMVVTILSLGGAVGTSSGFDTAVTTPAGYILGLGATAAMFVLARVTRSRMRPLMLTLGIGSGVVALSYLLATETSTGSAEIIGVPVAIVTATAMSGVFAATGFVFSVMRYSTPLGSLGFVATKGFRPYVYGIGMWLIGLTVLIFWSQILIWLNADSLLPPDTAQQAIEEAGGNILITVLLVGIGGPIAEEIFFRGFVLTGLLKRFGVGRALLISSLLFGLFHIDPGAIVPTFALGLILGWVYLKTGSIWPAMFVHGLHNTFAVLVAKYATLP